MSLQIQFAAIVMSTYHTYYLVIFTVIYALDSSYPSARWHRSGIVVPLVRRRSLRRRHTSLLATTPTWCNRLNS